MLYFLTWLQAHQGTLAPLQLAVSIVFYCAATVGVAIAFFTMRSNKKNQRETNARRAYLDLIEAGQRSPDLAFPIRTEIAYETQTIRGDPLEFEKYEWFVSTVLAAAHFIFESSRGDRTWHKMMILQMAYHWNYLERFRKKKQFLIVWDRAMKSEIDEAIQFGKQTWGGKYQQQVNPST